MLNWLKQFLFFAMPHQASRTPDSRPLYAYKISENSYAELKELIRQQLLNESRINASVGFDRLFCLYAAETFRREHTDGTWSYKTVFDPLGLEPPVVTKIHDWIETGLQWWKRPLLHSANGHRQFLVTIVVEGGLPLRLLERENANLTRFFRNILENLYYSHQRDINHAIDLAKDQAMRLLPRSLQHEPVFHLAGHLITKIVELQPIVGKATNPLIVLDQHQPRWRQDLPLRIEDQVAEALLIGLVQRSQTLAIETAAKLRWRGCLHRSGKNWLVEKRLELPASLTMQEIAHWVGIQDANRPRWRIVLQGADLIESVARLTLVQDANESARYRREWLKTQGVLLKGAAVEASYQLILHDGQNEYPVQVKHTDAWGHSPWIFVEQSSSGELEWLAEGSVRTKAHQVWVVAGLDINPKVISGECEYLGEAEFVDRLVYRIAGHVELITQDYERYRILCQATEESAETFFVLGDVLTDIQSPHPIYRGFPHLYAVHEDGRRCTTAYKTEWRFVGERSAWKSTCWKACGHIWLRFVEDDGVERYRKQINVVAQDFQISLEMSHSSASGCVYLTGIHGARVLVKNKDLKINILYSDDQSVRIECPTLLNILPTLDLLLYWPESKPVQLTVPYPQRGVSFRLAGNTLARDDLAPVDRLGGMQIFIQDPTSQRFYLEAELITNHVSARSSWSALDTLRMLVEQKYGFQEALPPLENKQLAISLFHWQERIESLLASSDDLEDQVRLSVVTRTGERLASIRIARFDVILQPDKKQNCVLIPERSLLHLGADWESRITLKMLRLWEPKLPAIVLQSDPHQAACWLIPDDLEPGPWWIIGYDCDWVRFRPLLWSVMTDAECPQQLESASSLSRIICEANAEKRLHELDCLLVALGEDANHPDWPLLFSYLNLSRDVPPSALDIVRQLVKHPRTLAQALLRADDAMFETVWSLASSLPFLWELIAVNDWLYAAQIYFGGSNDTFAQFDGGTDIVFGQFVKFRERMSVRRPLYWKSLSDWLQERLFDNRPLPRNSELQLVRHGGILQLQILINQERDQLLLRHEANEIWPQSQLIKTWLNTQHDWTEKDAVLFAPTIAAQVSYSSDRVTPHLTHQLRLLRLFDPDWFDFAYAVALTTHLAEIKSES